MKQRRVLTKKMARLNSFKRCKAWVANYMRRNALHSRKGMGQNGRLGAENIASSRLQLKKKLTLFPAQDTLNSGEVALLHRSIPSHMIRSTQRTAAYEDVKNRLTAIFSVFVDVW